MSKKKKANPLSYGDLNEVNSVLQEKDEESRIAGANMLLEKLGVDLRFGSAEAEDAYKFIESVVYDFLEKEDYVSAAVLLFGFDYFDPRSQHVQDLFRIARDHDKIVAFGASSLSKTFALGVWLVCDYIRDPEYTNIIVTSVGESHLKGNLFSGLIQCVNSAIIDLDLDCKISSMSIKKKDLETQDAGIYGKTFPQDKNYSTGRLRGIKPVKRKGKPHPKFGKLGRVRILLDEASSTPEGVYLDFGSAMASNNGEGRVKFMAAFNPTIVEHWTTEIAKPVGGIELIDEDKDIEWESERGWHVYRLDGMRSPNVIARKEVCAGVMTWESMKEKIASGENSMDYWVYGRGMWMRQGHFSNIIPMNLLTNNRGEFIFPEGAENVASVDVAFAGDKVVMTIGRWGIASGFMKPDAQKEFFMVEGNKIQRWSLQIDQQFQIDIPRSDSVRLANEIIRLCKDMDVKAHWLAIDRTGIGQGTYDIINTYYGDLLGINWQTGATEIKIFAEDQDTPKDLYANVGTEMWFTMKHWLEHGVIKIGLAVLANPLFTELTTRRYKPKGVKFAVESKPDYKARSAGRASPDYADSCISLPHICRMRGDYLPSLSGKASASGGGYGNPDAQPQVVSEVSDEIVSLSEGSDKDEWDDNDFSHLSGMWEYGR